MYLCQKEGSFEVPHTSITYFDPYKKDYAELSIPGFAVNVVASGKTDN